jgi:hypothetical protein
MAPVAQSVLVICVVAATGVLVATLLAIRKTALRADTVLGIVEQELRPTLGELRSLTAELRQLSRATTEEMARVSGVVQQVEDVLAKAGRLLGVVGSFTRVGQYAGVAAGLKKGVDVFVRRLKTKA